MKKNLFVNKTFLTESEFQSAQEILRPMSVPFNWQDSLVPQKKLFSHWLGDKLLEKLEKLDGWEESHPIALGSWARNELCPKSDIDILLCGSKSHVKKLVSQLDELGIRIRHRYPEDIKDWTVGVEAFDVLAIMVGKAFTKKGEQALNEQQEKILKNSQLFRRQLIGAMKRERNERNHRYDSLSNYLEPNIKYGSGGLRDLQQALAILQILPEKFEHPEEVRAKLINYKMLLLNIRQKMHLLEGTDVMSAHSQMVLAEWVECKDLQEFMRQLQSLLAGVSFFTDWVFERVRSSKLKIKQYDEKKLSSLKSAFLYLEEDSSAQAQNVVRIHVKEWRSRYKDKRELLGKTLARHFNIGIGEKTVNAIFRSGLMSLCVPELEKVAGHVQHDQYHRLTVDAHLLQTIREVLRMHKRPNSYGPIGQITKTFKRKDWDILLWTALYHDLAKARGGNHSTKGANLVKKDFAAMKISLRTLLEVSWLVENHLLMSTAAFRRNPQSSNTWKDLHNRGVKDNRLDYLTVFTAIDIKATNSEAWNEWKERLLFNLYETMKSPKVTKFARLLEDAERQKIRLSKSFLKGMDPSVVEALPTTVLLRDYALLHDAKEDLEPLVLVSEKKNTWIRLHSKKDSKGLFVGFVNLLYSLGCGVQECSVQTFTKLGAYDWFKVKTNKSPAQLRKMLKLIHPNEVNFPKIKFDHISIITKEDNEAIISFRGKDRKGALLVAANALYEEGLLIKWARAHTWGRQLDDVFCVKFKENIESPIGNLRDKLLVQEDSKPGLNA